MASTPYSDINLPKEVTDPLYTSSQSGLNTLGTNLLNGQPLPGIYSDLGQFDSPAFQAMLNSVKGQVMQGSQEASAINGTGRSGVATTASNNALNSVIPQLSYQDYLNAQQQQIGLLGTGINVESGVRGSAQSQQQFDSNYNQQLYQDQINQAFLQDAYKKANASQIGQAIGTGVGAIGGFALGGPAGAIAGAGLGGSVGGAFDGSSGSGNQTSNLSNLFASLGKTNTGSSGASYGVSDSSLGSFSSLSSLNSGNPAVAALLNSGIS